MARRHDPATPPFSKRNRPWLTQGCIDAMNAQYAACMANIPTDQKRQLREWAITKVELHYCLDDPQALEACREYGEEWIREEEAKAKKH